MLGAGAVGQFTVVRLAAFFDGYGVDHLLGDGAHESVVLLVGQFFEQVCGEAKPARYLAAPNQCSGVVEPNLGAMPGRLN